MNNLLIYVPIVISCGTLLLAVRNTRKIDDKAYVNGLRTRIEDLEARMKDCEQARIDLAKENINLQKKNTELLTRIVEEGVIKQLQK